MRAPVYAKLMDVLREHHARQIFSEDGARVDDQVAVLLAGRRIATAESCTAGLVAARLTDLPGSSAYVAGGVVAYANEAKTGMLGVDAALIETHGAVSEPVAEAMARGRAAPLRRRHRGRDHRNRRARRGDRGQAGGDGVLFA